MHLELSKFNTKYYGQGYKVFSLLLKNEEIDKCIQWCDRNIKNDWSHALGFYDIYEKYITISMYPKDDNTIMLMKLRWGKVYGYD